MTTANNYSADQFFTGTGIYVGGNPFFGSDEGYQGAKLKDGREEFFMAVAFPKDQPAATRFNELWAIMQQVAQGHQYAAQYQHTGFAGFHWKLDDGDSPQFAGKAGYAGCWVVKFKNGFQPQVFDENKSIIASPYDVIAKPDGSGNEYRLVRPHNLKKGHFVRVMCSVVNNKSAPPQSGIYINFHMVQRVGYGPEIQTGPDYTSMMNNDQVATLQGMSAMPVGGAAPNPVAGLPGAPAAGTPGLPGAPAGMPAGMPGAPTGIPAGMPGAPAGMPAGMPGMPGAPGLPATPAPATPQSRMLVADYTYDQYIASGWTEDALIANGKMSAPVAAAPAAPSMPAAAPAAPSMPAAAPGIPGMPGTPPGVPGGHAYNA